MVSDSLRHLVATVLVERPTLLLESKEPQNGPQVRVETRGCPQEPELVSLPLKVRLAESEAHVVEELDVAVRSDKRLKLLVRRCNSIVPALHVAQ
jgi:hypothetical protein